ncbi:MAG: hypothetical protein R2750_08920 [Bacteroidales bacterium]
MINGQVGFRDLFSVGQNDITEFLVGNSNEHTRILDVTSHSDPFIISSIHTNGQTKFVVPTDSLREFVAFDGSAYFYPGYVGPV